MLARAVAGPELAGQSHQSARLAYPIRDNIPILLENEARPLSDEEIER